jgi:DNA-binding transcriptional ArsR family regulator
MSKATETLRSLLEDELGECCDGDVENRLAELDDLEERALDERAQSDVAVLDALAGETRYRLVRLLAAAEDELCVCELQPLMDVSDSTVSRSLSALADAGLVARRKEGRWRYYRATERAEALLDALDSTREGDA